MIIASIIAAFFIITLLLIVYIPNDEQCEHQWEYKNKRRTCKLCDTTQIFAAHQCDPGDGHPHAKSWQ